MRDPSDTGGIEAKLLYDVLSPSSRAGEMYLVHSFLDKAQSSWIYFPGQRRVRLAPSFAYDNPIAGSTTCTSSTRSTCSPALWIVTTSSWSARRKCWCRTTRTSWSTSPTSMSN
ncbi:DUF1329 domain-containing protein [Pseudomonas aeruginosa]|nr:DUF1329 domain-containing protein [Pseudomonas aeruginosa]